MGNHIVKDFHRIPLVKGSMLGLKQSELISPGSVVLGKSARVLVKRDSFRKGIIFFDMRTMMPLFVTSASDSGRHRGVESITKDANGRVLFFTTRSPDKKKKLIYRPARDKSKCDGSSCSSSLSSRASSHIGDLPFAAEIDIDRSGSAVCAFLSVVVWQGDGPELLCLYKAVKIQEIKFGALVTDMAGHVVGKCFIDEVRQQPIIEIAAGTDILSVLGITAAVLSNFAS